MKIKNINGTSDNNCKCTSWLDHWKNYSKQGLPNYCPEATCTAKPEVGAHVQKESGSDSSWYIVPLCKAHNAQKNTTLTISDSISLVSANVSSTCGASK
ncbi:hypothetical protein JYB88_05215 [Shewanella cyperi]|uniref:Uncharacterized protein n=1 Tax=Shewanella cyperi TaxID=2814292 RepID=A0A974XMB8_9GAMM|nr:hypothetical protein [Shewanella cyperi]QSX31045.1 hypothetical protein JYB88_05215 [Shewanella cyperi]